MPGKKISTDDCKQAIAAAWPNIFGNELPDQASQWKRISKRGKKGQPIERVFYHKSLPLQALVVETDGAISRTVIRGFAPFEAGHEGATEAEEQMAERADSKEAWDFFNKYAVFQPSDFVFRMCTAEQAEESGDTWYELFPTRDFGRRDVDYDGQVDYLIQKYLPDGDGEATEGTFTTERSPEDARAELLRIGFIADDQFIPLTDEGDDE